MNFQKRKRPSESGKDEVPSVASQSECHSVDHKEIDSDDFGNDTSPSAVNFQPFLGVAAGAQACNQVLNFDFQLLFDNIFSRDTENFVRYLDKELDINTLREIRHKQCTYSITPLLVAIVMQKEQWVQSLLERGANGSVPCRINSNLVEVTATPLALAMILKNEAIVGMLLQHGTNVNAVALNKTVKTADEVSQASHLILAALLQNVEILRLVLDHGAEVDKELIVFKKKGRIIRKLIVEGKSCLEECTGGNKACSYTSLMLTGDVKMAELLLEYGAQINFQASRGGHTALMMACANGYDEVARFLIERNADIDLPDCDGDNALTCATYHKRLTTVEMLIAQGAYIDIRNNDGEDVYTIAKQRGFAKVEQLFLKRFRNGSQGGGNTKTSDTVRANANINNAFLMQPQGTQPHRSKELNLQNAYKLLLKVASDWRNIGILLGIKFDRLMCIRKSENDDPKNCLSAMLNEWLTRIALPPSWQALADAVKDSDEKLSLEIESTYVQVG